MKKYTHLPLNEDVEAPAGRYTPLKEARLNYRGREVLYVVGQAVVDSSCCGAADYRYVIVPGYIRNWQNLKNEAGLPVSEIEPLRDNGSQREIAGIIQEMEHVSRIEFW